MFHFVQGKVQGNAGAMGRHIQSNIQHWKKEAEEWEDKVKKNQEAVSNIQKHKEQYEGES